MKKRCIAVVLAWVLFVSFLLPFRERAYASDPLTAAALGSAAAALLKDWGFAYTMGSQATAQNAGGFFANQIEQYVNSKGGTIEDVFVGQLAVDAAGKLVIPHTIFNELKSFAEWLIPYYNLKENNALLGMMFEDQFMDAVHGFDAPSMLGFTWAWTKESVYWSGRWEGYGYSGAGYGDIPSDYDLDNQYYYWEVDNLRQRSTFVKGVSTRAYWGPGLSIYDIKQISGKAVNPMRMNIKDYVEPTVLNPDQAWTGTIGGYSVPDTNLDQLLGDIDQAVSDNNLAVDGEVIDVPVPPEPVPTWTPVDDVIDGINQTGEILEGIGNDIGDISGHLDDMGDQIDSIGETLEGVQEGIQTQTGVISGAIDQATQDVADAIAEQTATLDQTLTETAEGVQDIADALQPGQITPRQFDLKRLFPFCIPFDIHNLLQKFDAEPVAPHVQLPFVIQSIGFSYMIDLDFSAFDPVAAVLRTVEFIVFAIGLAWATSKVIKW